MSAPKRGRWTLPWVVGCILLCLPSASLGALVETPTPHSMTVQTPYYPAARAGAAMVYDPVDGYVVLFGGSNGINDTWAYSHGHWTELPEPIAPAARIGACATWDATAGYLVLFGGQLVASGSPLANDTWTFVHGKWTELHPAVSPPPLAWAACAFDAAEGSIVMFGGVSAGNTSTASTWTFAGGEWTLQPVHEYPHPIPPLYGAAMLYWQPGQYVDMYGGQANSSALNLSWEWIEYRWQEINSGTPPAGRVQASVAVNSTSQVGVLFGGATSANGSITASTWLFGSDGRWSEAPAAQGPSARFQAGFAYDGTDQYFVLFGGCGSITAPSIPLNDTWTFSGANWTNISASADRPPPSSSASPVSTSTRLESLATAIGLIAVAVAVLTYANRRRRREDSRVGPAPSDGPTRPR